MYNHYTNTDTPRLWKDELRPQMACSLGPLDNTSLARLWKRMPMAWVWVHLVPLLLLFSTWIIGYLIGKTWRWLWVFDPPIIVNQNMYSYYPGSHSPSTCVLYIGSWNTDVVPSQSVKKRASIDHPSDQTNFTKELIWYAGELRLYLATGRSAWSEIFLWYPFWGGSTLQHRMQLYKQEKTGEWQPPKMDNGFNFNSGANVAAVSLSGSFFGIKSIQFLKDDTLIWKDLPDWRH